MFCSNGPATAPAFGATAASSGPLFGGAGTAMFGAAPAAMSLFGAAASSPPFGGFGAPTSSDGEPADAAAGATSAESRISGTGRVIRKFKHPAGSGER